MLECLFDRDNHNRPGLFAVDSKTSLEVRILADPCAPVHAISLIHPGHEENQSDTWVLNKVCEAINPIVTATVWYEQRPTVFCNCHEARLIALRRAVETLSASSRKNQKRRGGNKRAASLVNMVKLLLADALDRLGIKCPQRVDACHDAALEIRHRKPPFY